MEDSDVERELEQLQQEQLDEQMIGTGTVPVSDAVHKMPTVANGKSKCLVNETYPRPNHISQAGN